MILITGAAGFIASNLAAELNLLGYQNLVLIDDFSKTEKNYTHESLLCLEKVDRNVFFDWVKGKEAQIEVIFHLGARTDTAELSLELFQNLNVLYSQNIWKLCTDFAIPLVYASSAATYGDGNLGFSDADALTFQLKALNPYGDSKLQFDKWVLSQINTPPAWAGFRFFNVYGPNELHKGRMASVVLHTFRQIQAKGSMNLFRSHRPDFADGAQSRDFIYVKDVVKVLLFAWEKQIKGIFNLGTGQARSFYDLATRVFLELNLEPQISFIDTPLDIRDTYQYYTQADMQKLRAAGYQEDFMSLEQGVADYVARLNRN